MNRQETIAAVREIAAELSCRGPRKGAIGVGTRRRISELYNPPRPLLTWWEAERDGNGLPNATAEAVRAVMGHLSPLVRILIENDDRESAEEAIRHAAAELPAICDRLESLTTAPNDDDQEKSRGLQLWNDGATWREVNAALGRPDERSHVKATTEEIRRFAAAKNLHIVKGKAGAKKRRE